jgi:hypothetical protein
MKTKRQLAEEIAQFLITYPNELKTWEEIRWVHPTEEKVADWLEHKLTELENE